MARQAEHSGHHTSLLRADMRHDCGVVGGLEHRVACGDDDDGNHKGRYASDRRRHGQCHAPGQHPAEPPLSPTRVMRRAKRRSTTRPAGTPISALTRGPADMANPTIATSSPRP